MARTNEDAFANRSIATTDIIYITDDNGTTHKMSWADVEVFVEANIDHYEMIYNK